MKQLLKRIIRHTPYRVIRKTHANRFGAIDETLSSLVNRGFAPKIIFDGGANVGEFALLARRIFGDEPEIHMFEPQPACAPILEKLTQQRKLHFHAAALGSTPGQLLPFVVDPAGITTGAHVAPRANSHPSVMVPFVTLDSLFQSRLSSQDRAFLKLDLQGWELDALKGSIGTLPSIEVVLVEVSFFSQAYEPSIASIVSFFDDIEFDLYDIASLSGIQANNRLHQADFVFLNRKSCLRPYKFRQFL